jgi:hypothetical protein
MFAGEIFNMGCRGIRFVRISGFASMPKNIKRGAFTIEIATSF